MSTRTLVQILIRVAKQFVALAEQALKEGEAEKQ